MSDTNNAGASGTPTLSAVEAFIKGGAAPATVAAVKTDPATPAPAETPKAPAPSPIADGIKAMRERREREQAEHARKAQEQSRVTQLEAEIERYKRSGSFEDDPVGYAKAKGWDREQQLTFAKALMYDLAPDQADPNFRIKMFEDKQKREEAKKAKEAEEAKVRQAEEAKHQTIRQYAEDMESAVMSFEAGSYPESEAWFDNDVEDYLAAMFKTANKMASEAQKNGQLADLSPQAVAKRLEADTAARFGRRQKREQTRQPETPAAKQTPVVPADDTALSVDTASTKTLSGGGIGAPTTPARDDKERIQRAIAAGWGGR